MLLLLCFVILLGGAECTVEFQLFDVADQDQPPSISSGGQHTRDDTEMLNLMPLHSSMLAIRENNLCIGVLALSKIGVQEVKIKKNKAWKKCEKSKKKLVNCIADGHELKVLHRAFEGDVICDYILSSEFVIHINQAVEKESTRQIEEYKKSDDFKRVQEEQLQYRLNGIIRKLVVKDLRKLKFYQKNELDNLKRDVLQRGQNLAKQLVFGIDHLLSQSIWSTDPIVIPIEELPTTVPASTSTAAWVSGTSERMSSASFKYTWGGSLTTITWNYGTPGPEPTLNANEIPDLNAWQLIKSTSIMLDWDLEGKAIELLYLTGSTLTYATRYPEIVLYNSEHELGSIFWNTFHGFNVEHCEGTQPEPVPSEKSQYKSTSTFVFSKSLSKLTIIAEETELDIVFKDSTNSKCAQYYSGDVVTKIKLVNLRGTYYRQANEDLLELPADNQQVGVEPANHDQESEETEETTNCDLIEVMSNGKNGIYYMGADYIHKMMSKKDKTWMLYVKFWICSGNNDSTTTMLSAVFEDFDVYKEDGQYYFHGEKMVFYSDGSKNTFTSNITGTLPTLAEFQERDVADPLLSYGNSCFDIKLDDGLVDVQTDVPCPEANVISYRQLKKEEKCSDYPDQEYLIRNISLDVFNVPLLAQCMIGDNMYPDFPAMHTLDSSLFRQMADALTDAIAGSMNAVGDGIADMIGEMLNG